MFQQQNDAGTYRCNPSFSRYSYEQSANVPTVNSQSSSSLYFANYDMVSSPQIQLQWSTLSLANNPLQSFYHYDESMIEHNPFKDKVWRIVLHGIFLNPMTSSSTPNASYHVSVDLPPHENSVPLDFRGHLYGEFTIQQGSYDAANYWTYEYDTSNHKLTFTFHPQNLPYHIKYDMDGDSKYLYFDLDAMILYGSI
jgi:hypothetical protein